MYLITDKKLTFGDCIEFKSPKMIDSTDRTKVSIFLAGTIDNGDSEDWQEVVKESFKTYNVAIYNPRRDDWDSNIPQDYDNNELFRQIDWEIDAMNKADIILMNFLPNSKSPISLLELGLFADKNKLVVICPKEFYRSANVYYICNKYNIPLYYSFEEFKEGANN